MPVIQLYPLQNSLLLIEYNGCTAFVRPEISFPFGYISVSGTEESHYARGAI
jgi:hypothetical protein